MRVGSAFPFCLTKIDSTRSIDLRLTKSRNVFLSTSNRVDIFLLYRNIYSYVSYNLDAYEPADVRNFSFYSLQTLLLASFFAAALGAIDVIALVVHREDLFIY